MDKKYKLKDLPEFDLANYLTNDREIADYLTLVLEDGDQDLLLDFLGAVAKAKGMAQIADATGLNRESLYKALKAGGQPRLDTVMKVLTALGIKLKAEAA